MKPKTMLGSFLIVAIGLLAGAGSAAAVELCQAEEAECAEANTYLEGQEIEATGESSLTTVSPSATIKCATVVEAETAAEAGKPLPAHVTGLSFSKCAIKETSCSVATEALPYYAKIEESKSEVATLNLSDGGAGSPSFGINCGEKVLSCTVVASELALGLEGGEPAVIKAEKEPLKKGTGALCPTEASWTGTLQVQAPQPLRIASRPTRLCTAVPLAKVCPAGKTYTGSIEAELEGGTEAEIVNSGTPAQIINCAEGPLGGINFGNDGKGKISLFKLEKGLGACPSNWGMGNPAVKVTMKGLPYNESSFNLTDRGSFLVMGGPSPTMELIVESVPALTCVYRSSIVSWGAIGFNPMKLESFWQGVLVVAMSSVGCPPLVNMSGGTWVVKGGAGENLWVAATGL